MSNLVSVEWLKNNINNEKLIIVDCRFSLMDKDYGKKSYEQGHIKGSVRLDIETQLSNEVKKHGGRHPLPSIESLKETFENIGISNNSIIVCYDEGDLAGPSRLWWTLKYLGHDNVYVLRDGIEAFKKIGGEINTVATKNDKGLFNIKINEEMKVDMNYIRERLYNKDIAIVDSRENIRYIGEFEPVDKKAGHVPSALNYFWMDIFNKVDEKIELKSVKELKEHFKELYNYKEVIVYCGSGITASVNSLALDEADINHKVYAGSFSDWISYDDNEVETNLKN